MKIWGLTLSQMFLRRFGEIPEGPISFFFHQTWISSEWFSNGKHIVKKLKFSNELFFMKKWLDNFAYRTDIDFWICFEAGLLTIVITIFTVGYQVIRASIINPTEVLKYEWCLCSKPNRGGSIPVGCRISGRTQTVERPIPVMRTISIRLNSYHQLKYCCLRYGMMWGT